jgi:hypothetical protein
MVRLFCTPSSTACFPSLSRFLRFAFRPVCRSPTDTCADENHYTADYPEDEVESDDEYGRDDYRYRTGNASDQEEFDDAGEDEVAKSDDEAGLPGTKLWRQQSEVRSRLGLPKLRD